MDYIAHFQVRSWGIAEFWADEIMDIADDGTNDYVERESDSGTQVVCDQEHIQRSRLRVDTRKWFLSKLLPKKYGDRTALDVKGDINHHGVKIILEHKHK